MKDLNYDKSKFNVCKFILSFKHLPIWVAPSSFKLLSLGFIIKNTIILALNDSNFSYFKWPLLFLEFLHHQYSCYFKINLKYSKWIASKFKKVKLFNESPNLVAPISLILLDLRIIQFIIL
jgi:hypothetical protein